MKLTEVPFDQIKVGDKVISFLENPGVITHFTPDRCLDKRGWVEIKWDNGNQSKSWIFDDGPCLHNIEYIGRTDDSKDH